MSQFVYLNIALLLLGPGLFFGFFMLKLFFKNLPNTKAHKKSWVIFSLMSWILTASIFQILTDQGDYQDESLLSFVIPSIIGSIFIAILIRIYITKIKFYQAILIIIAGLLGGYILYLTKNIFFHFDTTPVYYAHTLNTLIFIGRIVVWQTLIGLSFSLFRKKMIVQNNETPQESI